MLYPLINFYYFTLALAADKAPVFIQTGRTADGVPVELGFKDVTEMKTIIYGAVLVQMVGLGFFFLRQFFEWRAKKTNNDSEKLDYLVTTVTSLDGRVKNLEKNDSAELRDVIWKEMRKYMSAKG